MLLEHSWPAVECVAATLIDEELLTSTRVELLANQAGFSGGST